MAVGYMTSSSLIAQVKREAMIPTTQSTFTNDDFLAIANQELKISMLPSILIYHQEYFTKISPDVPMESNQSNYPIPYRAVGGKFREVFYKDTSGQLRSMTRINQDDIPYYQQTNFQNRFVYFYLRGNDIVILPDVSVDVVGSIKFIYYFRPNDLVDESRAGTITNIAPGALTTTFTLDNMPTNVTAFLQGGSTITGFGSANVQLDILQRRSGHKTIEFDITPVSVNAINKTITFNNTDLMGEEQTSAIPSTVQLSAQSHSNFTLDNITTTNELVGGMFVTGPGIPVGTYIVSINDLTTITLSQAATSSVLSTFSFSPPPVPSTIITGDIICFAGECIIPQIPSDLHEVLAQRVIQRCVQALGDAQAFGMATQKLAEMEKNIGELVDNRAEGQPIKATNLRSSLRGAKVRKRGWI
jgi:hypothetical protein